MSQTKEALVCVHLFNRPVLDIKITQTNFISFSDIIDILKFGIHDNEFRLERKIRKNRYNSFYNFTFIEISLIWIFNANDGNFID